MSTLVIGNRPVGHEQPPLIIAELSANHGQQLERALALVDAAAAAGADAIKLQTYTADSITLDVDSPDFRIGEANSLWAGETLYQLYQRAATPYEWHQPLFERARHHGMLAFSSPFDEAAVDFLEDLAVPCYKIASFELTHLPLIRAVARTGKPIIMSTGMASLAEIEAAVACARGAGNPQIILLKCTSSYPAAVSDSNLRTLPQLAATFGCLAGLSDHTLGVGAAIAATALGAVAIEKHLVLSRSDDVADAAFSLEPHELAQLVQGCRDAHAALGEVRFGGSSGEQANKKYRRSIYIAADLAAGSVLTPANIKVVRPGFGLAPAHYEAVLGRRLRVAVSKGTALSWELLEPL